MKQRSEIIFRTAAGEDIIQTNCGDYYVLSGWDGEKFMLSYRSNYFGHRLDKEHHVIKPIYGEIRMFDYNGKEYPIGYIFED